MKAAEAAAQKAILDTVTIARQQAQEELKIAQADSKDRLSLLTAELQEKKTKIDAAETQGLISQKEALLQLEALQKQETAAKVEGIREELVAQQTALDLEEKALKNALTQITDENEYAKILDQIIRLEQQRSTLVNKAATEEHVASLQGQADLAKTKEKIEEAEKTWTWWTGQMKKDVPSIGQAIRTDLQGAISTFNKQFSADFAQMIVTGKNFGKDMKQLGQEMEQNFISMLVQMLLKWTETQIAMKILGITSAKAGALAEIPATAAVAGANMLATWAKAPWPINAAAPAMAAMAYGDAMSYEALALATGGVVTEPTLAMFGEKGDEAVIPLTDPVALGRISNALLSQPTMRIASAGLSSPTAIAAASNIRQSGFDDASLAKFAEHVGEHLDRSGGAAGDVHVHNNIKGMIDNGNLKKVLRKSSQLVKQNRVTLHASNALRVTRRSQ